MSGMDDEATERLSIGTFARLAGLSPSALRFYDDCGVLPPAEVDPVTGYRRYAPGQRERAVLLRRLRAAGLPLVAAAAVRQVAPAADPGHPLLRCVLLEPADGELRLVATDRYRLSVRAVPARVTARPWPEPLLVEAAALREVAEWARGAEEVALETAGADAVWVRDGERERRLPLVAGEFPAYRLVLDALEPVRHRVIADRVALGAALSQARTPVVVRTGGPAGLLVGETAVPALVTGPVLRVAFDPVVLAGAVESAVGPDVLLELGGEECGPVRVRSADQGGFTTLVMVVRDGS